MISQYEEEEFIDTYLAAMHKADSDRFREEVKLFQARANLSIASFLVHVGKGTSEDMKELIGRSPALID